MLRSCSESCSTYAGAVVVIEAIPYCMEKEDVRLFREEDCSDFFFGPQGRGGESMALPTRRLVFMPCREAVSLIEGIDDDVF